MKRFLRLKTIYPLIFANLIPLFGVYFADWKLAKVIALFWIEVLIIVFYNNIKLFFIPDKAGLISLFLFFPLYFFVLALSFIMINGLFLYDFKDFTSQDYMDLLPGAIIFFISHGISFVSNYINNKEYKNIKSWRLLLNPVFRIYSVIVSIYIFLFFFVLIKIPSITFIYEDKRTLIFILILVKLLFDLRSHFVEHKKIFVS